MNYSTQDKWDIWFHSITDNNWGKTSYKKLMTVNNLFDYKYLEENFQQDHYQNGMFFYMKDGIFPNWEDPDNRLGGCLSFKIQSTKIVEEWNKLLLKCITGKILSEGHEDEINGISISPKKEFNIIKIWFKDAKFNYQQHFQEEQDSSVTLQNSLYKKHEF